MQFHKANREFGAERLDMGLERKVLKLQAEQLQQVA